MRRLLWHTAAGLCLALPAGLASPAHAAEEGVCRTFGAHVEFVSTPSEAARRAKKEEKLVFVLHVSGNFENPRFT